MLAAVDFHLLTERNAHVVNGRVGLAVRASNRAVNFVAVVQFEVEPHEMLAPDTERPFDSLP